MTIETTGEALALSAETQRLLRRASDALERTPELGPAGLGALLQPMLRLQDALVRDVPELERVLKERIR